MLYIGVDQHERLSHVTAIDERGQVRISCQLPNQRGAFARVLEDLGAPCRVMKLDLEMRYTKDRPLLVARDRCRGENT